MARIESISIGGYYPTPASVVGLLGSLFTLPATEASSYVYLDPCAGDGAAVLGLIGGIHGGLDREHTSSVNLYTIEMEATRHADLIKSVDKLSSWRWKSQALHGDAFRVDIEPREQSGVSLLYLNPPYDTDPVWGRLEEKFLSRFTSALKTGGTLVFLVPFYALKASAKTLARNYDELFCFRFPGAEYDNFKQVALIATKRPEALFEPDPDIEKTVLGWASSAESIPELAPGCLSVSLSPVNCWTVEILNNWKVRPLDFSSLTSSIKPWNMMDRRSGKSFRIPGILPEGRIEDLLVRYYPVAMPPRSAHIAAGIAAGIFNGARIEPDNATSKLPPILVKGVFDKEYRTIEEKLDKDGNLKGVIQVQQPKLVTTALNLHTSEYVTIKPEADITGSQDLAVMTMADLLAEYGRGLMKVMLQQCPVLHDPTKPEDAIALPEVVRPLYTAQSHATQAAVKLLGGMKASRRSRRHKSAYVLGEIGSGKTSVALAAAQAIRSKRILVMCPPHLLQSWDDQIGAVVPWMRTMVLSDISDVQRLAADDDERTIIAIVSRETAKLGHALASVQGTCPKCGVALDPEIDYAKKRSRCEAKSLQPRNDLGKALYDLALALFPVFSKDSRVTQLLRSRPIQEMLRRRQGADVDVAPGAWERATARFPSVVATLVQEETEEAWRAVQALLVAHPDPWLVGATARVLCGLGHEDKARAVLMLMAPGPELDAIVQECKAYTNRPTYYQDSWKHWSEQHVYFWEGKLPPHGYFYSTTWVRSSEGQRFWGKIEVGDQRAALEALSGLTSYGFQWGAECGEPLFQAVPEPRRYPLATFIARRHPQLFDLLILDEGHEYATDGSAQERSAHRLTALGIPTMLLTGTVMNGYAESLFTNMWAMSEEFRLEFSRDDRASFVDRYGYRKRFVEDRDKDTNKVVEYGSMTDRIERSERVIGNAPGILPIFLLKHLLPKAVTLHKTDLAIDIPTCTETVTTVVPDQELLSRFKKLQDALLAQIKRDRFQPDLAGKLWGALADLPSYLDLATTDTGNRDGGSYSIRYPESVGGGLVAEAEPFSASCTLPKEAWLLEHLEGALKEGRNVLVFAWHTVLLPRLSRLITKHLGIKAPILDPAKVPTKKRQEWIDTQVVAKGARVLLVNPIAVQTGLNNLVYFSDEVWMENPACNPTAYRQAVGRVDRIGQTEETRIMFPLYDGTTQQDLHSLLMQKVAVSMSTDGLDAESALRAAGVGDDSGFSAFAVGRQLYEMLTTQNRPEPKLPKRVVAKPKSPVSAASTEQELFAYAMALGE